jgi:hypothetical protein
MNQSLQNASIFNMINPYSAPASAYPSSVNLAVPTRPQTGDRSHSFVHSLAVAFTSRHDDQPEAEKSAEDDAKDPAKLPFRERIRHFTWTWFTMTMATGGIANML